VAELNVCNHSPSAFLPDFDAIYLMSVSALGTLELQQCNLLSITQMLSDAVLFNRERSRGRCLSIQVLMLHYLLFDIGCSLFDPTLLQTFGAPGKTSSLHKYYADV